MKSITKIIEVRRERERRKKEEEKKRRREEEKSHTHITPCNSQDSRCKSH